MIFHILSFAVGVLFVISTLIHALGGCLPELLDASSATNYADRLGVGIDMDAPAKLAKERYGPQEFQKFYERGVCHIRIRMKVNVSGDAQAESFMALYKQIVDEAIAARLYPIISYHANGLEEDPLNVEQQAAFVNWWKAISNTFQSYRNILAFNLIIEITGNLKFQPQVVNDVYSRVIQHVRLTQATRIVICAPTHLSEPRYLYELNFPALQDNFLLAEWHDYAAGPIKYDESFCTTDPVTGDVVCPANVPFDYGGVRYWNDLESGSVNSIMLRAMDRQRIRETIAVAKRWSQLTATPLWIGAWMPSNFNKAVVNPGGDYSKEEYETFAKFCAMEFVKHGMPHAWNAAKKFYDLANDAWFANLNDTLDIIVSSVDAVTRNNYFQNTIFKENVMGHDEAEADPNKNDYFVATFKNENDPTDTRMSISYTTMPIRCPQKSKPFSYVYVAGGSDELGEVWISTFSNKGEELSSIRPLTVPSDDEFNSTYDSVKIKYLDVHKLRVVAFGISGESYVLEIETTNNCP